MEKKILFACDLDNTLLVSHRCRQDGDVCVELYQGREQSFLTRKAIELLRQAVQMVEFVPVTTRSIEQYKRIRWPEGCEPELAVTTNGAVLLRRGTPDDAWAGKVKPSIDAWRDEMNAHCERQSLVKDFIRCRIVDDSYLFLYCDEGVDAAAHAEAFRRQTQLDVEHMGRKIYFFPPAVGKGKALARLRETRQDCYVCAAGDSTMDLPMLEVADRAFAERALKGLVGENCLLQPEGAVFSEWMLEELFRIQRALL